MRPALSAALLLTLGCTASVDNAGVQKDVEAAASGEMAQATKGGEATADAADALEAKAAEEAKADDAKTPEVETRPDVPDLTAALRAKLAGGGHPPEEGGALPVQFGAGIMGPNTLYPSGLASSVLIRDAETLAKLFGENPEVPLARSVVATWKHGGVEAFAVMTEQANHQDFAIHALEEGKWTTVRLGTAARISCGESTSMDIQVDEAGKLTSYAGTWTENCPDGPDSELVVTRHDVTYGLKPGMVANPDTSGHAIRTHGP